ncbi:MAG: helix-turn-helix domain-containing protein [Chloroflexota bacterium]|nr:helix-turn-helix domain-containing protein [Chloroflexota bacterium]
MPDAALSNRVRECRVQEGLRFKELAELAEISEATLRKLEGGDESITEVTKYKVLNAFNSLERRLRDYTYGYLYPSG